VFTYPRRLLIFHASIPQRGVFQQNGSDLVIHPLPSRFGTGTHVLYQARVDKSGGYSGASSRRTAPPLDSQLQFEPDAEEFNEPRRRLRGQTQAQSPLRLRFQPRHHHHLIHIHFIIIIKEGVAILGILRATAGRTFRRNSL